MQQPEAIYKYMKKSHLKSFMKDGFIRIGTLYDFRNEEKHGKEIGDADEGTKTLTTDGYHFIDTADPSTMPVWLKEHFDKAFIPIGDARMQIHAKDGMRVRLTVPDRFVFCASSKFDGSLIEKGEYDACIKINSPIEFFNSLSSKLKHKASWLGYGECVYRSRIMLGDKDEGLEPSLIKENRYGYQAEIRAVWESKHKNIEPVIIKAKKARRSCEIVYA